jgi:carboxyl-terminal processing protease
MNFIKSHFKKIIAIALLPVVFVASIAATATDKYFEISKNLDVFATLYKELNTYYVDDVEPATLIRAGIDAMLETLDPYTNFISEDEMEDYRLQTTGKYGGIGAYIRKVGDYVVVSEPYENYPAFKAGLMAGDIITEIDGQNVQGKTSEEVSKLLKGQAGTAVTVKVKRLVAEGQEKEMLVSLTREEIKLLNVPYSGMINDEIGYIKLANFTENAGKEVREALEALKQNNPNLKGVVFDVRGNPGGLLNEAVNVSNVFVEKGKEIVSTKGKVKEWDKVFRSQYPAVDPLIPLVVLTNKGSASASEIVAGAIQDLDRGVVVGQKTFGKGLVQTTRPLSYNTKLKVTTAKYYVPSGRCIQAINYAEKDEDGSVKRIPDSLKTPFKTLNGRTVYDGGGIDPDITVDHDKLSPIAISLINNNHIFNYATLFKVKNPAIAASKQFSLSDNEYNNFINYLKDKEYDYTTETEESLEAFKRIAEKEKYFEAVKKDFEALSDNVKHDKEKDLIKFKDEIKALLEEEIVTRYYYSKGRTELSFKNDKDIQQALKVLNNKAEYYKILQPAEASAKDVIQK